MTANDLSAFVTHPHCGPTEVQVHCTQSTMLTADTRAGDQPRTARTATPLSGANQSPRAVTQTEACYLPPRRIARSEHSLTHRQEKCDASTTARAKHSPSDLQPDTTAPPEHLNFKPALLIPYASLLTVSRTLNFLFKVLFIFPSRYLFAIGLVPVFSFRRSLPPILG